jgi:hypothetical protein
VDIYGRILGWAPICFQLNQILERLMRQGCIGSPAIDRVLQVLQGQIGPLDSMAISFLQNLPTDYSTRSAVIEKTFRLLFCAPSSRHSQGFSPGILIAAH